MSSGDNVKDADKGLSLVNELPQGQSEEGIEVEEKVSIQKKVAYSNDQDSQLNIQNRIQALVREGYDICRIELKKHTDIKETGRKEIREEEIILFLKETGAD
jgi:hypothetical protein